MAFTNLFSKLSAIEEDVTRPDRSDFTYRNKHEENSRGRKRKKQQPGSNRKKRCCQSQTSDTLKPEDVQDKSWSQSECSPAGRAGVRNSDRSKPGNNGRQKYKTKHNSNVKRQQQLGQKQPGQKQPGQQQPCRNRGRYDKKDWGFSQRKGGRSSKFTKEEKPRFMTQEFKDQNALLVDGRLLCRHFLHGRCIKEDNCQLEHIQGYNGLLKEPCKFYIQGFCLKGERCLYMHKSFPCKFFHRKGKCLQEENCRFSHDPLNEVTEKLLDQVLQQEKDYLELRKEAKQDSAEPPANTDQTENKESNEDPEVFTQLFRPNFYNSADAEKEGGLLQTEEPPSKAAEAHRSPSNQQDPVCYAVENVLGPQLFRPLFSFSKTPGSEESLSVSACQASSDAALGSVNQTEVPYSVDAVLRSCKSTTNFTFGPAAPLPAKTLSDIPQIISTERQSSQNQNEKLSQNISDVANTSQENMSKSFSSLRSNNILVLKTSSGPSVHPAGPKNQSSTTCKSAETTSNGIRPELLNPPVTETQTSTSLNLLSGTTDSEISTRDKDFPEPPAEPKPSLSALTSQSLPKSFSPSLNVGKFKEKVSAVPETSVKTRDADNVAVHHFATKELPEILQNSKMKPSTLKRAAGDHRSSEISPKSRRKEWNRGCFSVESRKPQNRAFTSLFANPLGEAVTPASDSVTPTSSKAPQTAGVKNKTSLSFARLFAAPLSETPPFSQQSAENSNPNPEQRPSYLKSTLSWIRTDDQQTSHSQTSPEVFQSPDTKADAVKRQVSPVSSESECSGDTEQQLAAVSSPRETSANSILKTLFLHLKPYQEDGEVQDRRQSLVPSISESQKKKSCSEDGISNKQQKIQQKKKNESTVEAASHPAELRRSSAAPPASSEAAGGSTITCAGMTDPQARDSGTHTFPFKLVTHHSRLKVKPTLRK